MSEAKPKLHAFHLISDIVQMDGLELSGVLKVEIQERRTLEPLKLITITFATLELSEHQIEETQNG